MLSDIGVRGGITSSVHIWIWGAVEQHCGRFRIGPLMVGLTDLFILGFFEVAGMYCTARHGNVMGTADRVRRFQAQWLDVRMAFALPKRISIGFVHYARIKIHETRKQVERDFTPLFLFLCERLRVPLSENRSTSVSPRIEQRSNGKVPIIKLTVAANALFNLRDAGGKNARRIAYIIEGLGI
jgi:hypothetical protein